MGFTLAVLIFLLLYVLAIVLDFFSFTFQWANLQYFVDFPSLLITLVPALAFAIAAGPRGTLASSLRLAFGNAGSARREELQAAARFFSVLGNGSLLLGFLGTLVGLVIMLQNLSEYAALYPASAVALITMLYGFILKFLCYAAEMKMRSRLLNG